MKDFRKVLYDGYFDRGDLSDADIWKDLQKRRISLSRIIERYFPRDPKIHILDIGCGSGALVLFARAAGYFNIVGVDASPSQVSIARRLGIGQIVKSDVLEYLGTVPPGELDLVTAIDVFEHLTKDELFELIDLVSAVLKPGGRLIFQVPNGESPFVGSLLFGDFTHEQAFTESSIRQILPIFGLEPVGFHEAGPVFRGIKGGFRFLLWRLFHTLLVVVKAAETGDLNRRSIFTRNLLVVAAKLEI